MIKKLGKYEVLGVLGRGSMGVVYKGLDPEIGKMVAIKTMNQKILQQSEMKQRFYNEGAILGQIHHRNIISVYNTGEDGDIYYIAMEFLEGVSLEQLLKRKAQLSHERILKIIKQVCEGVHAAHQQSIIHRDLKPANIVLLEDDLVKVLDFGVAHFQNSQLTNSGMLLGTINYIAPEQITGLKVDYRADIFSIGVILYELLTGTNPFLGKNISQTMVKIVNENPPPVEGASKELMELVNKALHKDRNRRYISTKLMAGDIDRLLRGDSKTARPVAKSEKMEEARNSQREILERMVSERIEAVEAHIRREELGLAEEKLTQIKRLEARHASIPDLAAKLEEARKKGEQKRHFVEQLTYDTLLKANERLNERHYIAAIELCDKVLKVDASHQDAKVIKASAIRKLEQFLANLER